MLHSHAVTQQIRDAQRQLMDELNQQAKARAKKAASYRHEAQATVVRVIAEAIHPGKRQGSTAACH